MSCRGDINSIACEGYAQWIFCPQSVLACIDVIMLPSLRNWKPGLDFYFWTFGQKYRIWFSLIEEVECLAIYQAEICLYFIILYIVHQPLGVYHFIFTAFFFPLLCVAPVMFCNKFFFTSLCNYFSFIFGNNFKAVPVFSFQLYSTLSSSAELTQECCIGNVW